MFLNLFLGIQKVEKHTLKYERKNCTYKEAKDISSEIDETGLKISGPSLILMGGGFIGGEASTYLFDKETYVTLTRPYWPGLDVYLTVEQPVKKTFGIKRKMKVSKDLTEILLSFDFKEKKEE